MSKSKKVNRKVIKTQSCKHKRKVRSMKIQEAGGPAEWLNNITSSGGRLSQLHSIIKDLSKEEWRNLKAHLITASGSNVLDVKWEKLHPTVSNDANTQSNIISNIVSDKFSPKVDTVSDKFSPKVDTVSDKSSPKVDTVSDKSSPKVDTVSDKPSPKVDTVSDKPFGFGGRRTRRRRKKSSK
jgi:CRISPR/Cas system-associated endonuclease/helicase Cas3